MVLSLLTYSRAGHHCSPQSVGHLLGNGLTDELRVGGQPVDELSGAISVKEFNVPAHQGGVELGPDARSDVLRSHAHQVNSAEVAGAAQGEDASQAQAEAAKSSLEISPVGVVVAGSFLLPGLVDLIDGVHDAAEREWDRHGDSAGDEQQAHTA